jgi:SNF2 family DNA or RNA helicase
MMQSIGPFSKSSALPLVLTAPYGAAIREEVLYKRYKQQMQQQPSAVSDMDRLIALQRTVRAELVHEFLRTDKGLALDAAEAKGGESIAIKKEPSSSGEPVGITSESKEAPTTPYASAVVPSAPALPVKRVFPPTSVSVHPNTAPISGLVPRKTLPTYRTRKQSKREVKTYERELQRRQSQKEEGVRKKHGIFLKDVLAHRDEFVRFHRIKRMDAARAARAVRVSIDSAETQKEKLEARAEQRRLQALRENDMVAYNQLVQETKNVRLKFLLSQTDGYIHTINKMIEEQRAAASSSGGSSAPAAGAIPETEEGTRAAAVASSGSLEATRSPSLRASSSAATTADKYFESTHRYTEAVMQPHMLKGGDLKEYQLTGLQWLVSLYNNNLNGILADEMGLGKTIQAIALLAYVIEYKHNHGPFLVVAPLSTLSNWVNEFSKWTPEIMKVVYKGTPTVRKSLFKEEVESGHFNVLLTTYEYIMKDKALLKRLQWEYIIVDEGHRMKNAQSKFAQILGTQYVSKHRVLLTGTPLQNNLPELWALLNFLLPTIFNSVDTFDQWFNKPFASFRQSSVAMSSAAGVSEGDELVSLTQEERLLIVQRLHEVLRPFMLRRVKDQVLDQLPEKTEIVLRCDLAGWQRMLYRMIQQRCVRSLRGTGTGSVGRPPKQPSASAGAAGGVEESASTPSTGLKPSASSASLALSDQEEEEEEEPAGAFDAAEEEAAANPTGVEAALLATPSAGINNTIMQLRKICNHPYLFMADWPIDDDLIRSSGKFELLDRMLPKLKAAGHRVLIFSQMTQLMTVLEKFFELRKFAYLRLDGSTISDEREKRMYQFNDPNSPYFIFLLSTRAGGLGLNLATADTVFLFDSDWNPMMDAQAQDRAHRIGQKNAVRVFRLVTTSAVEEKILARATDKMNLTELVVEAGKFNKSGAGADNRELVQALLAEYSEAREAVAGDEEAGPGDSVIPDEDQINEMMALHESEVALYQRMDAEKAAQRAAEWASTPMGQAGAPAPPRLMPADDIPLWISTGACWHTKYSKLFNPPAAVPVPLDAMGNAIIDAGARKRKLESTDRLYGDNMTDAQFDVFIGERKATNRTSLPAAPGARARTPNSRPPGGAPGRSVAKRPSGGSARGGRAGGRGRGRGRTGRGGGGGRGGSTASGAGRGCRVRPGYLDAALTHELLRIVLGLRKIVRPDGSLLSTLFLDLPDRKHYPDYYTIIEKPVALRDISRKLRDAGYRAVSEILQDLDLMCENAKIYNGAESFVHQDALTIRNQYLLHLERLSNSFDLSAPPRELKDEPGGSFAASGDEDSTAAGAGEEEEDDDDAGVGDENGDDNGELMEEGAGDDEAEGINSSTESYVDDGGQQPRDAQSEQLVNNDLPRGVKGGASDGAAPPLKKLKFSLSSRPSEDGSGNSSRAEPIDTQPEQGSLVIRKRPRPSNDS